MAKKHWCELGPGWPDARGWVALGMFGLAWRMIEILNRNPALLANASFMQVVTLVVGSGGLLLVLAFYFASTKEQAKRNETQNDAATISVPTPAQAEVTLKGSEDGTNTHN